MEMLIPYLFQNDVWDPAKMGEWSISKDEWGEWKRVCTKKGR